MDDITYDAPDVDDVGAIEAEASRLGRRRFLQGAAAVGIGAAAGSTWSSSANALVAGASRFVALPKGVRVVDTRPEYPGGKKFSRLGDRHIRVAVAGQGYGVPAGASALVLGVVGICANPNSWLVVYPTGTSLPMASNINMTLERLPHPNMVTVKVGDNGQVDIECRRPSDIIVDVLGYYEPVSGEVRAGRFVPLPISRRAIDTRQTPGKPRAGSFTAVSVGSLGVPSDATAVMVNLTSTESAGRGFFTAVPWSVSSVPTTSTLNVPDAGFVRAVAAIVPISASTQQRFKVYSHVSSHLVVDVVGYYTGEDSAKSTDGLFVPVSPTRVLDTRTPGHPIGRLWPRWVVEAKVPSYAQNAAAVVLNVTGTESRSNGHFRVSAARSGIPETSNVNWPYANSTVPNHVVTRISSTYGFQIYASHGAHAIADLNGYFTGKSLIAPYSAYRNPPPPAAEPPWVLRIPRLGLTSQVRAGDSVRVTDAGHSWHWTGTGFLGQQAHVSAFAHRTEAGAPYRNLHLMQGGDLFTVTSSDREFTYRVVRRDLVRGPNRNGPPVADILAATRLHPGTTFSLIACTRTDYLPTSLNHRLIVTAELVSWREI